MMTNHIRAVHHVLDHTENERQGCAELVRDVVEERSLRAQKKADNILRFISLRHKSMGEIVRAAPFAIFLFFNHEKGFIFPCTWGFVFKNECNTYFNIFVKLFLNEYLRHVYLRQLIGALLLLLVRMHRAHAVADAVLRRVHKLVEARVCQPHVRVLSEHKHPELLSKICGKKNSLGEWTRTRMRTHARAHMLIHKHSAAYATVPLSGAMFGVDIAQPSATSTPEES